MHQLLNTLYVTTPNSYLRLEGETLRVEVEGELKLHVPLHHLGGVVCFGNVLLSPALIHRCAEDGRSVVLLDRQGQFKARMEGPVSGNILLRVAQHEVAKCEQRATDIARAVVAGKLQNTRQVLLRGAREAASYEEAERLRDVAELLAGSIRRLVNTACIDTLRGIEGDGAKRYFEHLNLLVKPGARETFTMEGRSRRPPRDRMNALLSFLYVLLLNDCRSALEGVGLDPQLGFLHAVRPGRPALALDLMEEFRAVLADRLALTLINRGQVQGQDFRERPGGAVHMGEDLRKTVLVAYQKRKQEEVTHPVLEQRAPLGLMPHLQARLLARGIRGEVKGYLPYIHR